MTSVPKLGQLRLRPATIPPHAKPPARTTSSPPARVAFAFCLLGMLAAGAVATFAAIRWYFLPVPITAQEHIRLEQERIDTLSPNDLLATWETLEATSNFSEQFPWPYQRMANLRQEWFQTCWIAAAVALGLLVLGLLCLQFGRSSAPQA